MLGPYKREIESLVADRIAALYGIEAAVTAETPPRREFGDLAVPAALELARSVKKAPRAIAEEIAADLSLPGWIASLQVEGPGFLNFYLDRGAVAAALLAGDVVARVAPGSDKIIVEHTNINPNKAAHIGHLRNAVLGDVLARTLETLGHPVEVQNYIDDTGVQLADVVVGMIDLRGLSLDEVKRLPEPFDFFCWDLYSEVGRWYEEDEGRHELRRKTLHELEKDAGARAEMGRLISRRVALRHLKTMGRLGIRYDLMTHESAILGLDFFTRAFERLKDKGAIRLETSGKNSGCWVMPLSQSREFAGLEDPDKVIVRSDETVTYVGKDIAYQMWKFGLLGLDFQYRFWDQAEVWETTVSGVADHPPFGAATRVINVIDARQSYLQKVVRAGLERLDHTTEAKNSIHFAYEMVSLSTAAARQLGFTEDRAGGRLEMSGRKGIGVKADDLLDRLEAKSREEITARNRDMAGDELDELARQITTAALRFFMVKATTNRVIAFDFDEALNFEGESGPYLLYSLVRVANIRRKLRQQGLAASVGAADLEDLPAAAWEDDLWDLIFSVAQIQERLESVATNLELSVLARTALELAQKFNAFYHRHPILQAEDEARRTVRLAAAHIFARGMSELCRILGLPMPEKM